MRDYYEFIKQKVKATGAKGFDPGTMNDNLFPFQSFIVGKTCRMGKAAIFALPGLGKTIMQLEWASQVAQYTGGKVLVLAPLAVSGQTIREGEKFGIYLSKYHNGNNDQVQISNYEQLENIDLSEFVGIVLDESSILKSFTGKYKNLIIDSFKNYDYKLACTATPSPNDLNELGNHAEFLDVMEAPDMRMRWFVRDEGMNNYRLKGHAEKDFFGWVGSWAVVLRTPSDLGFSDEGYKLPPLHVHEVEVKTEKRDNGMLFNGKAVDSTSHKKELRLTMEKRMEEVKRLVSEKDEQFLVWVGLNDEADYLKNEIPDNIEVRGSHSSEYKENGLLGFANSKYRNLITKQKIAQFGLNLQNCSNQIFASLDFSFEAFFQAIRRSLRFGQQNPVHVWVITTDTMENVKQTIYRKEQEFNKMLEKVVKYANDTKYSLTMDYERTEVQTKNYHIIQGDCVDITREIEPDSIDFSVFSPPFSNLFTYSDNLRDMGNCDSHEEFYLQYSFLIQELYRILKPGRLIAVHTKDLPVYKNSDHYTGLYDFTGHNHRLFEKAGFKYHSKITIWTDPVREMQRTKTQRLLYRNVLKDSTYSGVGLPEYVTLFRKWEGNEDDWTPVTNKNNENFPLETWQKWASPVWMDIRRTDVLNDYRGATEHKDEKHIAPLQIEVIKRLVAMYSNPGELVFSPFAGIGSEVYQAVKMKRYGMGIELKPAYFESMKKNVQKVIEESQQLTLF